MKLSVRQRDILQSLHARGGSAYQLDLWTTTHLLEHLMEMKLIEPFGLQTHPYRAAKQGWRITPAGRKALEEAGGN